MLFGHSVRHASTSRGISAHTFSIRALEIRTMFLSGSILRSSESISPKILNGCLEKKNNTTSNNSIQYLATDVHPTVKCFAAAEA